MNKNFFFQNLLFLLSGFLFLRVFNLITFFNLRFLFFLWLFAVLVRLYFWLSNLFRRFSRPQIKVFLVPRLEKLFSFLSFFLFGFSFLFLAVGFFPETLFHRSFAFLKTAGFSIFLLSFFYFYLFPQKASRVFTHRVFLETAFGILILTVFLRKASLSAPVYHFASLRLARLFKYSFLFFFTNAVSYFSHFLPSQVKFLFKVEPPVKKNFWPAMSLFLFLFIVLLPNGRLFSLIFSGAVLLVSLAITVFFIGFSEKNESN